MGDGARCLALIGSGEFEPWTEPVDRLLLDRSTGDGRVLILPAASAPEGDDVFGKWARMGLEHYGRLGIDAAVLPLKTRADADRQEFWKPLESASMVFFSGGNPKYLAETLAGSRFWDTLREQMDRGLAYAGCSAGVACLGDHAPDSSVIELSARVFDNPGLGLFPRWNFGPHWDALDSYIPGLRQTWISWIPDGSGFLAIDERTAVVGDGADWQVMGTGAAHVLTGGEWTEFHAGTSLRLPLWD